MGWKPDWMKPMQLIKNFPVKEVEIDSSKVHPNILFALGYNKYNPAPKKLKGYSRKGGLKTIVPIWF